MLNFLFVNEIKSNAFIQPMAHQGNISIGLNKLTRGWLPSLLVLLFFFVLVKAKSVKETRTEGVS